MYDTKSAKCENDTVSVSICVYLYNVCVVPNIKLVSLVCKYVSKKLQNVKFLKNS